MIRCSKYAHLGNEGNPDFDWSLYEDGWNGTNFKANTKIVDENGNKVPNIYCHESYAQDLYYKFNGIKDITNTKDCKKGDVLPVTDFHVVDDDTMIAVVGGGASNLIVDLNKEARFYQRLDFNDKKSFVEAMKVPEYKEQIVAQNMFVKVTTDTEKGSVWDGFVEKLTNDLKEQLQKDDTAYYATVISNNGGGFVVEIADTIKAFMPGSMAAINKITDYDSFIGRTIEVMVESWNKKYGFVVSRKKYLVRRRPVMIRPLRETLKKNPDNIYSGVVTGATQFGVFVEINEFITGMLHKTLVSDEMRERMRKGEVEAGTKVDVYLHKIEGDDEHARVIFSDVPAGIRDMIIAKRTAEDNQEKSEHMAQKAAQARTERGDAQYQPKKQKREPRSKKPVEKQ